MYLIRKKRVRIEKKKEERRKKEKEKKKGNKDRERIQLYMNFIIKNSQNTLFYLVENLGACNPEQHDNK